MLEEILAVEKEINLSRSTVHNKQDYLPFLRVWPFTQPSSTHQVRQRRDAYMNKLLEMLKANVAAKNAPSCITGNILQRDTNSASAITEQELRSICLTMVSAGLDTIPSTIISCVGHLSNPIYGQKIQERACEAIREAYPEGDAWTRCVGDEFIPYLLMLIKETMRYSTAQPISLPRQTVSDIIYNNALIPAGTVLLMNTLAANFDASHYQNPFAFEPERFRESKHGEIDHMGFGVGSRMCAGWKLAEREMYVVIVRLILKFRILPAANKADMMETNIYKTFASVNNMVVEPCPFFVRLEHRHR